MASILNNVAALQATRQLNITSMGMKQTIERLTTGKRINHASDDATGLATANNYMADSKVAHELRKTAYQDYYAAAANDGYLEEATNQVMRAVELAAGGNSSAAEFSSVGDLAVAAASKAGTTITKPTDLAGASTALTAIATARATIAATMAEAQSNANLYGIEEENKTAMNSNIMDADIGSEVVSLTKWQILSQAGTSALTNANTASQTVLGLLR
ncbi:flagellin [Holophaga foetida]|uniref:flagellin n=1 Tax=Holophaga foetida TaxID=35839 RepID=UPI00024749FD|nr:flagellin [Holophaga foetida]